MNLLLIMVTIFLFLLCLYAYCIMPNLRRNPNLQLFEHCLFAHRGLFTSNQEIPENSIPAFENAVNAGYGIELDVQLTKDHQVVVFHDHTLSRMCGVDRPLCELTYDELQNLSLAHSAERVPLFKDVLKLVNGKVPLLVEIKLPYLDTTTCQLTDNLLQQYQGDYCIESFNPLAVRWYKKHRKHIVRGQLSANLTKPVAEGGFFLCFLIKYLLLNFLGKPDFVAYCHKDKNNISFLLNKYLYHTPAFAWTIRSEADLKQNQKVFDSIIFDSFLPLDKHTI